MSQTTDPSEHPSQKSSEQARGDSEATKPRTIIEEHDTSSDSDASSHRASSRSATPIRPYGPETQYGLGGRVTARKSVPIPIRRTFHIPARDEAGPSRVRSRRVTPPPPVARAPVVRPSGMTPLERYEVSGMARDMWMHETLLDHHDHMIDAVIDMTGASSQTMGRVVGLLGHTVAYVHHLYMVVYLVMALVLVMFGWVIWRTRY